MLLASTVLFLGTIVPTLADVSYKHEAVSRSVVAKCVDSENIDSSACHEVIKVCSTNREYYGLDRYECFYRGDLLIADAVREKLLLLENKGYCRYNNISDSCIPTSAAPEDGSEVAHIRASGDRKH